MPFFDFWIELFKPLWRLSSSFCLRGHMVQKMMFEEFQDGCSMLDPLWHLNRMISAFLCNLSACCLPSSFCSRGYMVSKRMMFEEFQDGCLVLGNLWCANWFFLLLPNLHVAQNFPSISAQEDIWVGGCWLKNSKMAV